MMSDHGKYDMLLQLQRLSLNSTGGLRNGGELETDLSGREGWPGG